METETAPKATELREQVNAYCIDCGANVIKTAGYKARRWARAHVMTTSHQVIVGHVFVPR